MRGQDPEDRQDRDDESKDRSIDTDRLPGNPFEIPFPSGRDSDLAERITDIHGDERGGQEPKRPKRR